jgi:hypothetical protein
VPPVPAPPAPGLPPLAEAASPFDGVPEDEQPPSAIEQASPSPSPRTLRLESDLMTVTFFHPAFHATKNARRPVAAQMHFARFAPAGAARRLALQTTARSSPARRRHTGRRLTNHHSTRNIECRQCAHCAPYSTTLPHEHNDDDVAHGTSFPRHAISKRLGATNRRRIPLVFTWTEQASDT